MIRLDRPDDFIPHRLPIRFVDELADAGHPFRTRYTVPAESPYVADGALMPEALLEIMAQCFAAGAGYRVKSAGREVSWGYLAAVKHFRVLGQAVSGDVLEASCTITASVGPIHVVEAEVHREGSLLASAQIKIFTPDDIPPAAPAQP